MADNTEFQLERAILSKILQDPSNVYQILGYLRPNHLSVAQHEVIYKVMEELAEQGSESSYLLVQTRLSDRGELQKAGGDIYLEELYNSEVDIEDIKNIADEIIRHYMVRAANLIGVNMMKLNKSDHDNVESYLSHIGQQIDDLVMGSSGSFTESISNILREDWEDLKLRVEHPGITGISTGFSDYDLMLNGLNPGSLTIIAARPSTGKTALAVRQTLNIAKQNIPVLMFSYEMTKKELSQRMVAMESGIGLQNIRTGTINQNELEKIKETYLNVSNYPIFIDTNVSASIGYVLSTIRRYVKTNSVQAVFVDYIQLMSRDADNQTAELGKLSRAFKQIAMELEIPVIILSQLNRGLESRENKRPVLSDLRQSGNLEEDADIVTMLHRPSQYGKVTEDKENLLELVIRKNRNGPVGIVQTYFDMISVNIMNSLAELIQLHRN